MQLTGTSFHSETVVQTHGTETCSDQPIAASKARLRQFLDHLLQPKVTNVNPFAPRMTNPETVETILSSASNRLDMSASSLPDNV